MRVYGFEMDIVIEQRCGDLLKKAQGLIAVAYNVNGPEDEKPIPVFNTLNAAKYSHGEFTDAGYKCYELLEFEYDGRGIVEIGPAERKKGK